MIFFSPNSVQKATTETNYSHKMDIAIEIVRGFKIKMVLFFGCQSVKRELKNTFAELIHLIEVSKLKSKINKKSISMLID